MGLGLRTTTLVTVSPALSRPSLHAMMPVILRLSLRHDRLGVSGDSDSESDGPVTPTGRETQAASAFKFQIKRSTLVTSSDLSKHLFSNIRLLETTADSAVHEGGL